MSDISYALSEKDLLAAQYLHLRWSKRAIATNAALFPLMLFGFYLYFKHDDPDCSCFKFVVEFAIAWLCLTAMYWLIVVRIMVRREFKQNKRMQKTLTVSWDDRGVLFKDMNSSNLIEWKDLYKWKKNNDYFLFYVSNRLFFCMPKRLFSEEAKASDFEQHLVSAGIKYVRP